MENLRTPILLIAFNRPDLVAQILDRLAEVRPVQLFVAVDGPRVSRADDQVNVDKVKAVLEEKIVWDCQVVRLFREQNLGCRAAVSGAISWFFDQVEEGIILEDDTLPNVSFFQFASELLARYRNDNRIAMISGDNFQGQWRRGPESYYFSRYTHIWAWASWRRAWSLYDINMSSWPRIRDQKLLNGFLSHPAAVAYWTSRFDSVYRGEIDTWDYQWTFSAWSQSMLTILPAVNLVRNLGFRPDATHTTEPSDLANIQVESIIFPLIHPKEIIIDDLADARTDISLFKIGRPDPGANIERTLQDELNLIMSLTQSGQFAQAIEATGRLSNYGIASSEIEALRAQISAFKPVN